MPPPTIVNVLTVEVYFGGILQKNSMKERIKELFLALKKKWLLNKMNRINPNPAEYKKNGNIIPGVIPSKSAGLIKIHSVFEVGFKINPKMGTS